MKKNYTKKQIEEAIDYWSVYLLENRLATAEEVEELLSEGGVRRFLGGTKRFFQKVRKVAHDINWWPQKVIDKVFKENDGVRKMIDALNHFKSHSKDFSTISIYANITDAEGKRTTYPVVELALAKGKSILVLLIDKKNRSSKPKTLGDLRDFVNNKNVNLSENVNAIVCGEIPASLSESILLESKLTDYIEKKKWTKKDALKSNAIADINAKVYGNKKGKDFIKTAVEKYFASKPASTKKTTKAGSKKPAKSKKRSSSSSRKIPSRSKKPATEPETPTETSEPAPEPTPEPTTIPPKFEGGDPSDVPPTKNDMVLFDNNLLNVKVVGNAIGFMFDKTKAEIALDKKNAELLGI